MDRRNIVTRAIAQPAVSPLGTIRLASFVENGLGTGGTRMRRYPSYALVCLLGGLGYYRDENGLSMKVLPGDLIWVFPGVPHSYGPEADQRWHEFFVVFDGPVFDLWRNRKMFGSIRPVQHLDVPELWVDRLRKLCQISNQSRTSASTAIIELQTVLLDLIALQTRKSDQDEPWLLASARLIEMQSTPHEQISAIPKRFGISYEVFRKKFTRRFGMSPQQYRMRRIVQKAIVLLNEQNLSVKETASQLGFCDQFYFSRAFRKITGRPPNSLRKKTEQTSHSVVNPTFSRAKQEQSQN